MYSIRRIASQVHDTNMRSAVNLQSSSTPFDLADEVAMNHEEDQMIIPIQRMKPIMNNDGAEINSAPLQSLSVSQSDPNEADAF